MPTLRRLAIFPVLALALPLAAAATEAVTESAAPVAAGCGGERPEDARGLDTIRAGLERGVCSTARFVDRLFGGEHEYAEGEDGNNGRVGLALNWNEQDDFDLDGRFRASIELPALSERFNATIGRAGRDEYVADEIADVGPAGGAFSDDDPAEWFAGVGYRVLRDRDSRFDLGAGIKLESPLNPYVNARYRRYFFRGDGRLLTARTTFFVENDEGFGVTQAFDFDRVLGRDWLLRWGNSFRLSEETEGVRWRTRLALYQAIDYRRAMRYEISLRGESDGTQPDLYGFRVTHRRSMLRPWLFFEFGATLFWADGALPSDRCDACVGASAGFEVLFGDAYDRVLRREAEAGQAGSAQGSLRNLD
ncbi:MAG: hypothetical protein ACT4UP_09935 [Gammaproteobacteria bacterium]